MRFVPAFILDALLVLVFAVIGRASHQEDAAGFLVTAWPFLVALLLGHLVAALLPGRPRRPWSLAWGAVVWGVTVVGGLLLRVAAGDTAQVAFIIVATLVLGVLIVGWRAVAAALRRRSSARASSAHDGDDEPLDGATIHDGSEAIDERVETADPAPSAGDAGEPGDRPHRD
ncbi:DUF3054 domain-containing protein [Microbacterium sp. 1.5R]|uniref:DUF3054 domain-containing protein n=1 Tax=Microbacterium sp. 1.5R TaxID=1916917 RepID=UPI0011A901A1|nr:DUF3054 domain-containing protein [Microbacterium sp. 1.5R]